MDATPWQCTTSCVSVSAALCFSHPKGSLWGRVLGQGPFAARPPAHAAPHPKLTLLLCPCAVEPRPGRGVWWWWKSASVRQAVRKGVSRLQLQRSCKCFTAVVAKIHDMYVFWILWLESYRWGEWESKLSFSFGLTPVFSVNSRHDMGIIFSCNHYL